jgi:hypothetical protein
VDAIALAQQPQRPLARRNSPRPQEACRLFLQEAAGSGERQNVARQRLLRTLAQVASHGVAETVTFADQQASERPNRAQSVADGLLGPGRLFPAASRDAIR